MAASINRQKSSAGIVKRVPRLIVAALLPGLLGLLFAACSRPADIVEACAQNEELCLPCNSNADCEFTGNPCLSTVYCAHKDAAIAVPDVGCSSESEYSWPDASRCVCVDTCRRTFDL